jgi:hypothetical protein
MYQSIEILVYLILVSLVVFFQWYKRLLVNDNDAGLRKVSPNGTKRNSLAQTSQARRQYRNQSSGNKREVAVARLRFDSGSPKNWRRRCASPPPAPPPSPMSQGHDDDYLTNLRFLQSLEIHREDQIYSQPLQSEEGSMGKLANVPPEVDRDHERRSGYCKNSITDGEVMIEVGAYSICQFFVYGIEYHFCVASESRLWSVPDDIKGECGLWYLQCPRHIRKKFGLKDPPAVIGHPGTRDNPHFEPHVLTY